MQNAIFIAYLGTNVFGREIEFIHRCNKMETSTRIQIQPVYGYYKINNIFILLQQHSVYIRT